MTRLRYPGGDPENGPAYDPEEVDRNGYKKYDEFGNRVYRRKDGTSYAGPHRRLWKRLMRDEVHPIMEARDRGDTAAYLNGYGMQNPYPPGLRHDAFEEGYRNADPLGDHHGRNY